MENPRSVYSTACASGGMRSLPEQGIPTFQRPRSVNFSFSWKSGKKFIVILSAQRVHKEPNMKLERFKRYDVATDEQAEAAFTVVACIVAAILLVGICLVVRWLL